jgi:hypothetical protein
MSTNARPGIRPDRLFEYALTAIVLLIGAALVASAFERLPIEGTSLAIDWKGLYQGLQGGQVVYGNATGLRIAPWVIPLVLPLGFLSFRSSWGVLTLFTIGVLVVSVPRPRGKRALWLASLLLLVTSYSALRHTADGNFEGIIIAGALLIVAGYRAQKPLVLALGLLMATAKVQESWALVLATGFYVLLAWPLQLKIRLGIILAAVVVPCLLLWGSIWFNAMGAILERGSLVDVSLGAALSRMGVPALLALICEAALLIMTVLVVLVSKRQIGRDKAALLICASMLLAPYAAGNSFLTVLAIGIVPLFQSRPLVGGLLFALTDVQYVIPHDIQYWWSAYFWTAMLLGVWAICAYSIYRGERIAAEAGQTVVGTT